MFLQRILGVCVLLCAGQQLTAQQWTGAVDSSVANPANWIALPVNDGTAAITLTGTLAPSLTAALDIASLTFDATLSSTLNVSAVPPATLTVRNFIAQKSGTNQIISAPLLLGSAFVFRGNGGLSYGTLELSGQLTGTTGFSVSENLHLRVKGDWNVAGALTLQAGTSLHFSGGNSTVANAITNQGTVYFGDEAAAVNYSGSMSGAGEVHLKAPTTFSGANSYSGRTDLGYGASLSDAAPGAYSPQSVMQLYSPGAVLNVNHAQTIRGLDGAGNTTVNLTGNLTINLGHGDYDGTLTGTGGLILSGGGMQWLGGANTYSGGTSIQSGVLVATNVAGSATGSGGIAINPGAMLQLGNDSASGSVSGNITNHGTVLFARSDAYSLDAVISGSGQLSVGFLNGAGTGTLTLMKPNTYTGHTQVSSGTLRVGVANALPTTTSIGLNSGATLAISANQQVERFFQTSGGTLQIDAGATLRIVPDAGAHGGTLESLITGGGALAFAGTGGSSLGLNRSNAYTGGTTIESGTLYVAQSGALGTGNVTIAANAGLLTGRAPHDVSLANAMVVGQGATLGGSEDALLVLDGKVTVAAGAGNVHLHHVVQFAGGLQAASANSELWLESADGSFGRAVLTSTLGSNIAVVRLDGAGLIFGAATAVPSPASVSIKGNNGYVGIVRLTDTAPAVAAVLSLIDRTNFVGTLGFDTPGDDLPWAVFNETIDLSTFGNLTLGSSSAAKLTGTLIPSSAGYLFGNGGGALAIATPLTGAYGLTISSTTTAPANKFFAVLQGNNTFTGPVSVSNSALLLDSAAALPTGRTVTLAGNSYLGYTETFTGNSGFLDFISTRLVPGGYSGSSVIGLDSAGYVAEMISSGGSYSRRIVSEAVDLRALGPIGFGTLTRIEVYGEVFAPTQGGAAKTLTLVPVEEGEITLHSNLKAGQVDSVVIGSGMSAEEGVVLLTGTNTYAGGTTLQRGTLVLHGSDGVSADGRAFGPIGTGVLTVSGTGKGARLMAGYDSAFLANAISLLGNLTIGQPRTETGTATAAAGVAATYGYGSVWLDGPISGAGSLSLHGSVTLNGENTFSGGVYLHNGAEVTVGSDMALGTGTLNLGSEMQSYYSWYGISAFDAPRTVSNAIVYSGSSDGYLRLGAAKGFTFNGSFTLNNNLQVDSSYDNGQVGVVRFQGGIGGFGRLTLSGLNRYYVEGSANNPGGGIVATRDGTVIFTSAAAVPTRPGSLLAGYGGYLGIQFVPTDLEAAFLSRFNKAQTTGTIGFDSASVTAPNTFSHAINLSSFDHAIRLGSASSAVLTGAITPQWDVYRFGNGGGYLDVRSNLGDGGDGRALLVQSDSYSGTPRPLMVRLGGTNTFSGGGSVRQSGLIFGSTALPTSGQFLVEDGYIGTEDPALAASPQLFVDRLAPASFNAVIGFDGTTVTGAVDLTRFTAASPNIFLGTSTTATLQGNISLPSGQTAFRFAGFKGGQLTVSTVLTDLATGPSSVVIGSSVVNATAGDHLSGAESSVTLKAENTYTGGTRLDAGILYVAHDQALGTGQVVAGNYGAGSGVSPSLLAAGGAHALSNALSIGSYGLNVGGADNLTLSGIVSGTSGGLNKVGSGMLTLSGANTLSTWIDVQAGGVTFKTGGSIGTAELVLSGAGANATFEDHAIVPGLYAFRPDTVVNLTAGKTLTIGSAYSETYFAGSFAGTTAGLNLTGGGLYLSGASTFSGPVTLQDTTVVAANHQAFGAVTNLVTVNVSQLSVSAGTVLQNPVALNGATLAGSGTFKAAAGASGFNVGSGTYLAPGMEGAGTLTFDGSLISTSVLILSGGGTYQWDLYDAATPDGVDRIVVNGTLNIAATGTAPFNFKLRTVDVTGGMGLAANFDPTQAYTWTVLTATSITGFTGAEQFDISRYDFLNHSGIGVFSLSLNPSGTSLMLNFNPVPEPSTYAMMLTGLGAIAWVYRRRRKG